MGEDSDDTDDSMNMKLPSAKTRKSTTPFSNAELAEAIKSGMVVTRSSRTGRECIKVLTEAQVEYLKAEQQRRRRQGPKNDTTEEAAVQPMENATQVTHVGAELLSTPVGAAPAELLSAQAEPCARSKTSSGLRKRPRRSHFRQRKDAPAKNASQWLLPEKA